MLWHSLSLQPSHGDTPVTFCSRPGLEREELSGALPPQVASAIVQQGLWEAGAGDVSLSAFGGRRSENQSELWSREKPPRTQ